MGSHLSRADFDACSSALGELQAWTSASGFAERALGLLSRLVAADRISYEVIDDPRMFGRPNGQGAAPAGRSRLIREKESDTLFPRPYASHSPPGRHLIVSHPAIADIQTLLPRFIANLHTHPLFRHFQEAGCLPRKISDAATLREFMDTAVYQEFYQRIGARREMLFFLRVQGETRTGFSLSRSGSDFSERDRSVLAYISPHLTQAYLRGRQADETASILKCLERGFSAMNRAVILAERGGRIRWMTPLARVWIEEFLHSPVDSPGRLPQCIRLLLRGIKPKPDGGEDHPCDPVLRVPGQSGCQFVTRVGVSGEDLVVVLSREDPGFVAKTADHFGLTRRQGEALYWASEGKSNVEIAGILGLSPRTIQKHLEIVFAKLGVESRWAAQRLVSDLRSG